MQSKEQPWSQTDLCIKAFCHHSRSLQQKFHSEKNTQPPQHQPAGVIVRYYSVGSKPRLAFSKHFTCRACAAKHSPSSSHVPKSSCFVITANPDKTREAASGKGHTTYLHHLTEIIWSLQKKLLWLPWSRSVHPENGTKNHQRHPATPTF